MPKKDLTRTTMRHERMGGSTPVVCRGCRQLWPCPDAVFLPLKDYTKYICPNDTGYGHSSTWTGAHSSHRATWRTRDGYCMGCGAVLVEEVDDGTRWRVSFELYRHGSGWAPVSRETSSERDARSQYDGLLEDAGGLVRNPRLERSTTAWQPVTSEPSPARREASLGASDD